MIGFGAKFGSSCTRGCHAIHRKYQVHFRSKSHAARILEDLAMSGRPFFIAQSGEAGMVESVRPFQENESLIAALKIVALGEKEREQGKGIPLTESRAQLAAAHQRRR